MGGVEAGGDRRVVVEVLGDGLVSGPAGAADGGGSEQLQQGCVAALVVGRVRVLAVVGTGHVWRRVV
jgi:hypothetical protein